MSQPERYRPVLVSKNKVEMQQCVSGDWTSLSCYYLLHDRVVRAEDNCAALAAENERLRKLLEMYLKADPLIGEAVASAMLAAKEGDRK